ncbi:hypothetical protein CRV08_07655 [Halarcobacter ebronensis]|uniref:DUF4197 domain-containing protein n=1 Tax=Halarcobacter ebronensis TaxID=1462615 RepID=A0A4Q0YDP5_9BACT|nr:DUF4197 domain-containing protein [Halarcobacter ebronensis]RXJ68125.1 hypothetical protein CRV08_07655 [Halarcobacter ebronensis]
MRIFTRISLLTLVCVNFGFSFDLNSFAKDVISGVKDNSTKESNTTLSNSTITDGLKETLKIGVNYAVETLGKENGYLNNSLVKIPLPENLQKAETIIRKVGGDKVADELIASMNKAATQAAPKTADIFVKAIEKMSLEDAKKILEGNNNAATEYFKTNTSSSLKSVIKPIIEKTMEQNSVAGYYDSFNSYYKQYAKDYVNSTSVMSLAKNFGVDSYLPSSSDENLNDYVTQKAIDGLFSMIAKKEAAIRENPVEQTTSLLKQLFSK